MTDSIAVTDEVTQVVAQSATTTLVVGSTNDSAVVVEEFRQVDVAAPGGVTVVINGGDGTGGGTPSGDYDPAGTAAAAVAAHEAASDPHPQYLTATEASAAYVGTGAFTWANLSSKPTTFAGYGVPILAVDVPALDWAKITTGKPTTLAGYGITDAIPAAQKGAANGVAPLGADGKIPSAYVSAASAVGQVEYQGTWDASAGTAPTASPQKGFYFVVTTAGSTSLSGITDWKVGDWAIYNGTAWDKVDNTDAISSWNGRTGAIVPAANDYTFAQIGSKPTTLSGYGITDAVATAAFTWANIGSKPTTVAGFGITDAVTDADVDAAATANKIAMRDANGDVNMRLARTTWADEATISGGIVYRVNNTTNNFLRVCTSTAAIKNWLGVAMADVTDLPAVSSAAGNSTIVQRNANGYIYANFVNLNGAVTATAASHVHVETATDGFIRRKTVANFRTQDMGLWVQSADPGASASDGDLWIW